MAAITEVKDGKKICRICLLESTDLFSIFQETHTSGVTIAHILSECTRYPVSVNDKKLPKQICSPCLVNARLAYDFKLCAEKAYQSLMVIVEDKKCYDITNTNIISEKRDYGTQTDRLCLHPCELCEMKFFDLLELRQHRKQVHNNSNLQCRICGVRFERIRQLRSHLVHKHPSVGIALDIQCSICRRRFSRREHLNRHLRNVHHQPEMPNIKVSLKEPEIELSNDIVKKNKKIKQEKLAPENMENNETDTIRIPQENKSSDSMSSPDKYHKEVNKSGFPVTSLFFECGQDVDDDVYCENNMDTNPISSDEEAYNDIDISEDILPQLKLEHEPNIKVECELNETADRFDMTNLSTDWERSKSPLTNNLKEEYNFDTVSNIEKTNSSMNGDDPEEITERRRIAEVVNEFLALNSAVDETADNENRCTKCQRTFSRHCHLRRHMLTHVEEKAHACNFCTKRFARSDHLKKHIINLHHEKEFKCNQCNSAFARSIDLTKHIETRHGSDPQAHKVHNCEYCSKKFTSRTYLRKHILLHTDRIYACKFCEDTFKDRKLLREHEKGHHSERRNFLCSICGESFVRNDYLRVHMRRHNGEKPYKCQYCGKGFPRTTDVKIHERYHTGTKPNLCNLCGKGFHRAYNLTIHMRTHTGERPFKCEECGRGFAQSNDLKAHIRRHTGERFKCTVCDAGFLQMYALRQHAFAMHGIYMEPTTGRLQRFPPSETTTAAEATPGGNTSTQTLGEDIPFIEQERLQSLDQKQKELKEKPDSNITPPISSVS